MKQQIAQRTYHAIPKRASAINAATTKPDPSTSYSSRTRQRQYDAGMDMLTTRTKNPYYKAPADQEWFDSDDEEDEPVYQTRPPRSAVVYRRPYTQVEPVTRPEPEEQRGTPRNRLHPLVYIGLSMLIAVVFIVGYIYIPPAWQRHVDDVTYGYPRTFQMDENVGHGGVSHFIVLNVHGTIEVLELPSDPGKFPPHIYVIVRFTNQGSDLIPATVSFTDVNGSGKPDMQVTVYNGTNPTIYILFNDGTTFKSHL